VRTLRIPAHWLPPPPFTVHENDAEAVAPEESRTVTVTLDVPAVEGVPVMVPVDELIDRPAGRPVAEKVYGVLPPVAPVDTFTAVPTVLVWLPGFVTRSSPGCVPPRRNSVLRSRF